MFWRKNKKQKTEINENAIVIEDSKNSEQTKLTVVWQVIKNNKGIILAGLVAIIILLLPSPQPFYFGDRVIELTLEGQKMIALLAVIIIIFITEALPIGGLVALVYSWVVFLGIGDPKTVASIFSHDAAWFLIGALMIASVLTKYGLHKRVLVIIFKIAGNKIRNIVLGIVGFCAIASAFIADHTIAALMLPVVLAIINLLGGFKKIPNLSKLLLFSIAYGAAVGGLSAPSGGGRNVLMIGFLEDNLGVSIGFGSWMLMGFPITLILIPIISFWLLKVFKPEVTDLKEAIGQIREEIQVQPMKRKEWMTVIIFLFILILWIFKSSLGIGMIALFGSLLFLIFGLAKWEDYQKINWGIGLLYFGAVGFGFMLRSTGAATWLGAKIALGASSLLNISGGLPMVGLATGIMTFFTEIMADGPAVASIGPVMLELAILTGTDPIVLGVAVAMSSAFAMTLIIATPPNAIIYGSGYLKAKDFLKAGIGLNLICLVVLMLVVYFWWGKILNVGIDGFY